MNTKKFWMFFLCVSLLLPAFLEGRGLTGGRGVPVVSDPRDLSLVDLRPISKYIYQDLRHKGSFGLVRRTALAYQANKVGIPNPRKKPLSGGFVVTRGSSGNLSVVMVLQGEIKFKDIKSAVEKDYKEYMRVNGGKPEISQKDVGELPMDMFSYGERDFDVCIGKLPEQKLLIVASIPRGDHEVLEDTISVLRGNKKLNSDVPKDVETKTSFSLTPRELKRMASFNRPKSSIKENFNKKFKSLSKKLGIPQTDDERFSLDERIRGQIALSKKIDISYHWDVNSSNSSAYEIEYDISMPDSEKASQLEELVSEQITQLVENTKYSRDQEALGQLTVNSSGDNVKLKFLLDSPEAQYKHLSMVFSQVLRYRSFFAYLDRYGKKDQSSQ